MTFYLLTTYTMAPRKHPRFDLKRKKPVFLRIGYIIALAAALTAFEWKCHSLHYPDEIWMGPGESVDVAGYCIQSELIAVINLFCTFVH